MSRLYSYDGDCGLSAEKLLTIIAVETAMEQFGIDDVVAGLAIVSGANVIRTRWKPGGATKNTSIASLLSRRALRKARLPPGTRLYTITGWLPPRISRTPSIGGFVGRAIPVLGWAYTATELGIVSYKTITLYNHLVDEEDKILQW